ncbi:MAG: endonuclease/exonuclease/phosphatase family protein [Pseudomonadota bacterium]|nr:endonuclease/exonuclease/phosphatase family protein [Pseudomonadota bacterium]
MAFTCVSYNIQYGIGLDGVYDVQRIAGAVRDADIIALQEVTRGSPLNGGVDMEAALRGLFADRFAATHLAADADMGTHVANGVAVEKRLQFGNMILSRWPLRSVRRHLLPRRLRGDQVNLQRGALEAVIDAPEGALRVYNVHLDHIDAGERLEQIAALKTIIADFPARGGAISGVGEFGFAEPPLPEEFLVMGDFNFEPASPEHAAMLEGGIVDASAGDTKASWTDSRGNEPDKRLDFCFASPGLAGRLTACRIDSDAAGSDHRPLWTMFG